MKELKELYEENESINRFFDDEFLGKILKKKDEESINRFFDDEFLGRILEKKDDEFFTRLFLKKIRNSEVFKKKIQQEMKNELL